MLRPTPLESGHVTSQRNACTSIAAGRAQPRAWREYLAQPPAGLWPNGSAGDGEFNRAKGTAASRDGLFYVVDSANHRVQYFK